jgi:hypothetical protein
VPPPPPPADVIVENTEFEPEGPVMAEPPVPPDPPAPTVTGYVVALIIIPSDAAKGEIVGAGKP